MNRFSGLLDRAGQLATQVGGNPLASNIAGIGMGALGGMAASGLANTIAGQEAVPDELATGLGAIAGGTLGVELLRKAAARRKALPSGLRMAGSP